MVWQDGAQAFPAFIITYPVDEPKTPTTPPQNVQAMSGICLSPSCAATSATFDAGLSNDQRLGRRRSRSIGVSGQKSDIGLTTLRNQCIRSMFGPYKHKSSLSYHDSRTDSFTPIAASGVGSALSSMQNFAKLGGPGRQLLRGVNSGETAAQPETLNSLSPSRPAGKP